MRRGTIFTLTSFRGGVGRTMAVANLAWLLASSGRRVLAIDWNLNSPRLGELFSPFWPDFDPRRRAGVIDLLWEYVLEQYRAGSTADGDTVRDALEEKTIELAWSFHQGGQLHFLNAGLAESYRVRRQLFPWNDFFSQLGGQQFIELMREALQNRYDYVLIDGPLVLQDASAVTTVALADAVAFCCVGGGNDIEAMGYAAERIVTTASSSRTVERTQRVFPVLMRAEQAEQARLQQTIDRMQAEFDREPFGALDVRSRGCVVPQVPYYSYGNPLVADGAGPSDLLIATYRNVLSAACDEEPPPYIPPSSEETALIAERSKSRPAPIAFDLLSESGQNRELRPCTATGSHFFVSYRRECFKRITVTLDQIQKMGFDVWWDEGIPGGIRWQEELARRIESCRAVLLFFDQSGTSSEWVRWELQRARQFAKPIVPIQLDRVDPGAEVDDYVKALQFLQDPGARPSQELETTLRRLSL